MRCGCISLGDLLIGEAEGVMLRLCVDCCLNKGYARYTEEKGQQVLTLFPEKP